MPQKKSSPPPVMTWAKASWVLVIAGIFDALRYMFLLFWFFGPALAGIYCAAKVGNVALVGKALVAACVAGAAALGIGGFAIAVTIGTIMAIAVGFLGWLTVTLLIFMTDARTFKENPFSLLWIFEGIGVSVAVMAWGVYGKQIKTEKAAYARWKKETADTELLERNQQIAQIQMVQAAQEQAAIEDEASEDEEEDAQEAEFEQQEAINDAVYDASETHNRVSRAA